MHTVEQAIELATLVVALATAILAFLHARRCKARFQTVELLLLNGRATEEVSAMPDSTAGPDSLESLSALLQSGDVQGADNMAKRMRAAAQKLLAEAAGTPAPPAPPRTINEVWIEFLTELTHLQGNPSNLSSLLTEITGLLKAGGN